MVIPMLSFYQVKNVKIAALEDNVALVTFFETATFKRSGKTYQSLPNSIIYTFTNDLKIQYMDIYTDVNAMAEAYCTRNITCVGN